MLGGCYQFEIRSTDPNAVPSLVGERFGARQAWVHWGDMQHDSFADVVAAAVKYYGLQWDRRVFTSPGELDAAVSSLADFAGARDGNDDASSSSSDGGPGQGGRGEDGEWSSDDSLHSSSSSSSSSSSDGESDDGAKVSFLLCTVTFHANLAHSLTRSP